MIDLHTHSTNSFDGYDSPEAMVISAIEKGVSVLAITDHCEVNRWFPRSYYGDINFFPQDTFDFAHDFFASMEDNIRLREKYAGKINILCGIELGNAQICAGLAEAVARDARLDHIIGSVHQIEGEDDFAFIDYSKRDVKELLNSYFKAVYEVCRLGIFDTLGHLTYPMRYIEGEYGITVNLSDYCDIISECFREVIAKGKCIEINTSGLRQKYKKTFPDKDILKLYKDIGGKYVTAGSDAHKTDDIAYGFPEAREMAEELGLKLCYFEKHEMRMLKN